MDLNGRTLLHEWLALFANEFSLRLSSKGETFDRKEFLDRLSRLVSRLPSEPVIYVLSINMMQDHIPLYVGKTNTPLKRWASHINGLEDGKGHYAKWREILLENGRVKFDVILTLIPASRISKPPIPDFPTTIGSVEYQLVALVSENYPDTSLNVEGKRR